MAQLARNSSSRIRLGYRYRYAFDGREGLRGAIQHIVRADA
jgi:hypothetical protein